MTKTQTVCSFCSSDYMISGNVRSKYQHKLKLYERNIHTCATNILHYRFIHNLHFSETFVYDLHLPHLESLASFNFVIFYCFNECNYIAITIIVGRVTNSNNTRNWPSPANCCMFELHSPQIPFRVWIIPEGAHEIFLKVGSRHMTSAVNAPLSKIK